MECHSRNSGSVLYKAVTLNFMKGQYEIGKRIYSKIN